MIINNYSDISPFQMDVLKELGNIGMGNAATALAQMLSTKVDMSIPEVILLDKTHSQNYLGVLQKSCIGIILSLSGDVTGYIVHILRKTFAEKIINIFFPGSFTSTQEIDEMSMSIIYEVGNIASASYVNALASMSNLFIDISTPKYCDNLESELYDKTEHSSLLFINNDFFFDNEEIKSNMIFLPDIKSLNTLFGKLGV